MTKLICDFMYTTYECYTFISTLVLYWLEDGDGKAEAVYKFWMN